EPPHRSKRVRHRTPTTARTKKGGTPEEKEETRRRGRREPASVKLDLTPDLSFSRHRTQPKESLTRAPSPSLAATPRQRTPDLHRDPITEATSHAVFLDAGKAFGRRRRVLFSVACFALFWFYFFVLVNCWNRVPAVSYGSAPSCPLVSTSLTPRQTTASPTPLWVASSSHGSLRLTASPVSRRLTVSSAVHLHVTTHPLRTRRSTKALDTRSARLSETAEPKLEFQSEPPLLTAVNVHHIPPLDAAPLCTSRTTRSTHPEGRLARSGGLCVSEASHSLRSVSWPSQLCEMLGLDEIYGSRYGTSPHLCRIASVSQSLPRAAAIIPSPKHHVSLQSAITPQCKGFT
ncbi:hypothetical protein HID58_015357, partial [Brassica napus]